MESLNPIEITRRWIVSMVIGLDLCPFAKGVFDADLIRYTVSEASDASALLVDLTFEMQTLVASRRESVETSFLIHPIVFGNFLDFNDFLGVAENLVLDLGLSGIIQILGFHPNYQFHGTDPEAPENYTNRSPYPMIHLLREDSISEIAGNPKDLAEIPRRNIEKLKKMGAKQILERLAAVYSKPTGD